MTTPGGSPGSRRLRDAASQDAIASSEVGRERQVLSYHEEVRLGARRCPPARAHLLLGVVICVTLLLGAPAWDGEATAQGAETEVLVVQTQPILPDARFSLDGTVFRADASGLAIASVREPGTYRLTVVDGGPQGTDRRFSGWSDGVSARERSVVIETLTYLEARFVDVSGSGRKDDPAGAQGPRGAGSAGGRDGQGLEIAAVPALSDNDAFKLVVLVLLGLSAVPILGFFIARPTKSIIPLYALSLPVGNAVELRVELPSPFDTLSSLLGGLVLACCLAHLALYRDGRIPSLAVAAWLAFLGWALATTLWALEPSGSFKTLSVALPLVLLLLVVSFLPWTKSDVDLLRIAIVVSGAIVGSRALFSIVTGAPLPTHGIGEGQRFSVISNPEDADPNILAATLLLPLALSLELAITGGGRSRGSALRRLLGASGILFSAVAIVLTGSRGGVISAVIVLVLSLYFSARIPELRRKVLRTIAAMALFVFVSVSVYYVAESLAPGSGQIITSLSPIERLANPESSGRISIWTTGYMACKEYCDSGAGIGNFDNAYQLFYPYSGATGNIGLQRPAHNMFLQLVVETGSVGIVLLIVALVLEWRTASSLTVSRLIPSLKAAMAGVLVSELFLTAIWFKFFWLVFICARAAEGARDVVHAREESEEPVAMPRRAAGVAGLTPAQRHGGLLPGMGPLEH
jgi:O-antigen ligase